MNLGHVAIWGFVGTVVLTTILAGSQGLKLTRINLPYLLGTMITPDRDRAKLIGVGIHLLNGWIFAFVYAAAFEALGRANWALGALAGLVHASFVLVVGLPMLPALHPRMANEQYGPTVTRQLEPPGFLGLHYGLGTPLSIVLAHLVYGAILGGFYRPTAGPAFP